MKGFDLTDLAPQGCEIELEINGHAKRFRLRKFSLMAQLWITREWGSMEAWEDAINPESEVNVIGKQVPYIEALCKTLHYLLEDRETFANWEDFASNVGLGVTELLNMNRALMVTIGVSQPIADRAVEGAKKKMKAGVRKRGPK